MGDQDQDGRKARDVLSKVRSEDIRAARGKQEEETDMWRWVGISL
jgi:hypothetical protein